MSEINIKENNIINSVLKRYNINAASIERKRSAYKIQTESKYLCLKKMKHGEKKAENGYNLVSELNKHNFNNTPAYILTSDRKTFVYEHKYYFYITEWIDGVECSMDDINEAAECMKLLANFHKSSMLIDQSKICIKNNLKNWPLMFKNCINEMERFKKIINKKRIRTKFDNLYINNLDKYIERAEVSLAILNNSEYYTLSKLAEKSRTICHDSFYYQNVMKKDDNLYLIDLDSIIIDLHINDVGKLIRRLMYKKEYKWSFDKAKLLIDAYKEIKTIDNNEIEAMLALILFPHKFWKIGRKRYVKNKSWNETKYTHKLKHILKYCDNEEEFLNNYINYLTVNN